MREIDRAAIEEYGIPETILMENAGLESIRFLEETFGSLDGKRIGIFCGKGNNGGDGFVIARHLHLRGVDVAVYLLAEKGALKGDARLNMEIFRKMGGRIKEFLTDTDLRKHKIAIRHADALIDAILGTGINSELKGIYKTAVEKINEWKRFCLAIDIPTGLCSDRGDAYGLHVHADATVSFGFPKTGMMFYPSAESVGRLKAVNISFPPELLDKSECDARMLDGDYVSSQLPAPSPASHKGSFGHVVVSGGTIGMGGAVGLASLAALKTGAGLSTAVVPAEVARRFELGIPEVMSFPLSSDAFDETEAETLLEFSTGKSVLVVGPGMGRSGTGSAFMQKVVASAEIPMVIDADGLNNLAGNTDILKKAKAPIVVTPHPGEMARLLGASSTAEINANRLGTAKEFSARYNCVTVLKGARTVIADPSGKAYVNPTGNPNLASGGTGDVLAGMIGGLLARGLEPVDAACVAVYLHGLAANIYTEENDHLSMSASNLIDFIPVALSAVNEKEE